jgi:hypothetical protein
MPVPWLVKVLVDVFQGNGRVQSDCFPVPSTGMHDIQEGFEAVHIGYEVKNFIKVAL